MVNARNLPENSLDKPHRMIKCAQFLCYHKQKYADEVRVYGKTIS